MLRQPAVQRALPAIASVMALALAGGAWLLMQTPAQAPLYVGLSEPDKAAISDALRTSGIGFSVDPVSGTLTVDQDMVHQARIALAGQGLPKAQPSGGSMVAELPMGVSRAVEGETLKLAREADLARTIEAIESVKSARLHIAAPEPSPFVRESTPAAASVMLTLEQGRGLSDGQVQAIRFLVASSVPGLDVERVSVIDQRGALLSDTASNADLKALQVQAKVEERLRTAIGRLITPMLGPDNFAVEVNADIDLSESQATRETYPSEDRALRSEQSSRSVSGSSGSVPVGIPGALSNLPPDGPMLTDQPPPPTPTAGPNTERLSNENLTRSYEVGREIRVTHEPQGRVRRISVAVALNQGKKAMTQAEITKLEGLVKGAVGYDASRGDQVAISQRPFVSNIEAEAPFWTQPWFAPMFQQLAALLAAALVFFFVGRPLIRGARARAADRVEREALLAEQLLQTGTQGQANAGRAITLEMIEAAPSYEARAALVRHFVRQDPARATQVIRQMITEDGRG